MWGLLERGFNFYRVKDLLSVVSLFANFDEFFSKGDSIRCHSIKIDYRL